MSNNNHGNKRIKILIAALIAVCVFTFTGCATYSSFSRTFIDQPESVTEPAFTIGVIEPQSGKNADKGKAEIKGIELANSIYNNVDGYKVNLVKVDTQSTVGTTETAIQALIEMKPVAIIGSPEDSIFSVPRKGFEYLSALEAASSNYAVTNEEEMIWYCWEVLGYPASFVSTYELSQLKESEAVEAMPAFPAEGCCAFIGETLVIRLN